jgi:hypothetical protein
MKTRTKNQKISLKAGIIMMVVLLLFLSKGAVAQDQDYTQTLFRSDVKVTELWTPEMKINSIQGQVGTLVGFYGGALINRTFLLGIAGGVNLGHPRVNYGYFGGIAQVIINPAGLVHCSGQLLVAYGTTKDYEDPKEGLLDNFWNISGAPFFILEPGINLELNLSKRVSLVGGVSYRNVSGLPENNENVQITHLTSKDMCGLNINIGLKIGKKVK